MSDTDLLPPTYRIASGQQALHYSIEKAGLVLHDQPIPWNAEAVLIEASLHLPTSDQRQAEDFQVRLPGREAIAADSVRPQAGTSPREKRFAVVFRVPPPTRTQTASILWRGRELGRLELPVLAREQFVNDLRLHLPTLYARLGEDSVACKTFVSSQCKGLLASALLVSPTSLAPLADLDLAIEFRTERETTPQRIAVRLSSTQLAGRQALSTLTPVRLPRGAGLTTATWFLGDRELARQEVRGITLRQFHQSLRVSAARFILQKEDGTLSVARSLTPEQRRGRLGPCFLVYSSQAGMAGICSLRITARVSGAVRPPLLWEQDVLITDGPAIVMPGTLDPADLAQVSAFELSYQGKVLHQLLLGPAPVATFNSEGGFRPPEEFAWSSAADAELDQRLGRLLEERFPRR